MTMYLYDDASEMEEFRIYQQEVRRVEKEFLEIRILLRDAEEASRADPGNEYNEAKVKYLRKRLRDLENQAPRLASDHPLEIALWAPPHG
jgi:polyhydroxyalkanoate synthesis regulator phasin